MSAANMDNSGPDNVVGALIEEEVDWQDRDEETETYPDDSLVPSSDVAEAGRTKYARDWKEIQSEIQVPPEAAEVVRMRSRISFYFGFPEKIFDKCLYSCGIWIVEASDPFWRACVMLTPFSLWAFAAYALILLSMVYVAVLWLMFLVCISVAECLSFRWKRISPLPSKEAKETVRYNTTLFLQDCGLKSGPWKTIVCQGPSGKSPLTILGSLRVYYTSNTTEDLVGNIMLQHYPLSRFSRSKKNHEFRLVLHGFVDNGRIDTPTTAHLHFPVAGPWEIIIDNDAADERCKALAFSLCFGEPLDIKEIHVTMAPAPETLAGQDFLSEAVKLVNNHNEEE